MTFARKGLQGVNTGAKLYITPASGSYATGNDIVFTVRMDSYAVPVNAVQANMTYPDTLLQFVSASGTGSPFNAPLQNSGANGLVQYAAGILGGSTSADQLVATFTFTVLAAGTAAVQFTTGSMIADEATSSDICRIKLNASYTTT
jgi:hypothetical protein